MVWTGGDPGTSRRSLAAAGVAGLVGMRAGLPGARGDQRYAPPVFPAAPGSQSGIFKRITIGNTVILAPTGDATGSTDFSTMQNLLNQGFNLQLAAGTFFLNSPLEYPGGCTIRGYGYGYGQATTISGVGTLPALLASKGWLASANTSSQAPVQIQDMELRCNSSVAIALVTQNFRSVFRGLRMDGSTGDLLRMDFFGANGTTGITNTCVENRVQECIFDNAGAAGFNTTDPNTTSSITDGWLTNCTFATAGTVGINISASAGWVISGCHCYGIAAVNQGIMQIGRPFWTKIIGNLVENLGQPANLGTYSGIQVFNCQSLNGAIIAYNHVAGGPAGNAGSVLRFIDADVASGQTAGLTVVDNQLISTGAVGTINGIVVNNGNAASVTNILTNGSNTLFGTFTNPLQLNANGGVINHVTGT